jgi:hypothetical protein
VAFTGDTTAEFLDCEGNEDVFKARLLIMEVSLAVSWRDVLVGYWNVMRMCTMVLLACCHWGSDNWSVFAK